jgi:hypothetical protein
VPLELNLCKPSQAKLLTILIGISMDLCLVLSRGANMAATAPSFAAFSLPLTLMPAFLDHKRTTLPKTFSDDYYGESESSVHMGSSEQPLTSSANDTDSNNSDDDIETTTGTFLSNTYTFFVTTFFSNNRNVFI